MAALFIAEVRDIYLFDHYKKVEKMAGVNLRLSQSGNTAGPRHISHIGNNRLRWVLYKMTEETAKYIPEVRIKFLKRQLKKTCYKKNLMAATPQMLRLIMALVKENRPYEYRKETLEEMKRLEEKYEQQKKQTQRKKRQAAWELFFVLSLFNEVKELGRENRFFIIMNILLKKITNSGHPSSQLRGAEALVDKHCYLFQWSHLVLNYLPP